MTKYTIHVVMRHLPNAGMLVLDSAPADDSAARAACKRAALEGAWVLMLIDKVGREVFVAPDRIEFSYYYEHKDEDREREIKVGGEG